MFVTPYLSCLKVQYLNWSPQLPVKSLGAVTFREDGSFHLLSILSWSNWWFELARVYPLTVRKPKLFSGWLWLDGMKMRIAP